MKMKLCYLDSSMKRPMPITPYTLTMPLVRTTAAVFSSPHSGREYPKSFVQSSTLDKTAIRSSEDAFVDQLFDVAPQFGAPLLCANVPRAFIDFNRSPDELDPALISGVKQSGHNPRITSGLGVIPRVVANGRAIRRGKISQDEARKRMDDYYHPYHGQLQSLMKQNVEEFGFSVLFDCHSMPHEALASTSYAYDQKPEIVLGDRFGATCASELMDEVESAFRDAGLRTCRNLPFAGAYIVQKFGRPAIGHHAIQIEIDRSLYLDERKVEPNGNFENFRDLISQVVHRLSDIGRPVNRLAAQ